MLRAQCQALCGAQLRARGAAFPFIIMGLNEKNYWGDVSVELFSPRHLIIIVVIAALIFIVYVRRRR